MAHRAARFFSALLLAIGSCLLVLVLALVLVGGALHIGDIGVIAFLGVCTAWAYWRVMRGVPKPLGAVQQFIAGIGAAVVVIATVSLLVGERIHVDGSTIVIVVIASWANAVLPVRELAVRRPVVIGVRILLVGLVVACLLLGVERERARVAFAEASKALEEAWTQRNGPPEMERDLLFRIEEARRTGPESGREVEETFVWTSRAGGFARNGNEVIADFKWFCQEPREMRVHGPAPFEDTPCVNVRVILGVRGNVFIPGGLVAKALTSGARYDRYVVDQVRSIVVANGGEFSVAERELAD